MLVPTRTTTNTRTPMAEWHSDFKIVNHIYLPGLLLKADVIYTNISPKKYVYLRGLYRTNKGTSWSCGSWIYNYLSVHSVPITT
jgi:hypothetical protein